MLARRDEKLIPLRHLTTIVMPHRAARASLRQAKVPVFIAIDPTIAKTATDFRRMSAIQILKYGLSNNLWK